MKNDASVAPRERSTFEYRALNESAKEYQELPLKILVAGDLSQREDARSVAERRPFSIDKDTFNQRMAERSLRLDITVPDMLSGREGAELSLSLRFASLKDFAPDAIARQIPAMREMLELRSALNALKGPLGPVPSFKKKIGALLGDEAGRDRLRRDIESSRRPGADKGAEGSVLVELLGDAHIKPQVEGYDTVHRGLSAFLESMMSPRFAGERADKTLVDAHIAEIDAKLTAQINPVLHHPALQRLESAWRSLKYLVDHVDFRENVRVDVLDCSKEDLAIDFEDAPDTSHSGLYEVLQASAHLGIEKRPCGLIVADYEFGPSSRDVWLLSRCAAVAEVSHAPFIAAAAPSMAGASKWADMPHGSALEAALDGADRSAWRSFRTRDESRYVGLCAPRVMLRLPFGNNTVPVKWFNFDEDVIGRDERYLWGNAAFAFAACVANAFAKYRLGANIIGPEDGALFEPPLHQYESGDQIVTRQPTEATLSERDLSTLSAAGFIAITERADREPFFANAPSCHLAEEASEVSPEALGQRLQSQLPYLFMITRVAHYVMALHGVDSSPKPDESGVRARLEEWLRGYVAEIDDPAPGVRSRRPFREGSITLETVHTPTPGYHYKLSVRPHFTFEGAPFVLSVAGRLSP